MAGPSVDVGNLCRNAMCRFVRIGVERYRITCDGCENAHYMRYVRHVEQSIKCITPPIAKVGRLTLKRNYIIYDHNTYHATSID